MWLDHAWRDARDAMRALARAPGFTTAAVLTLALGTGANTAMFSVVYGVLIRPLAYRDPDRLALIQREQDLTGEHRPIPSPFFSQVEIDGWQARLRSFESTTVYSTDVAALSTDGGAEL